VSSGLIAIGPTTRPAKWPSLDGVEQLSAQRYSTVTVNEAGNPTPDRCQNVTACRPISMLDGMLVLYFITWCGFNRS
jgi:hypothetical protein